MKFQKIESLRGLAALYVVFHHTVPHNLNIMGLDIGVLFRFGQEAVIIFFLLSGFVVNYSHQNAKDKSFSLYFFKRFSRIYIPLIFIYALGYIHISMKYDIFIDPDLGTLLKNIFMLQDIESLKPNVLTSPYMGDSPLWSLSYEWWFYMLYFPIQKINSFKKQSLVVFFVTIFSAIFYVFYPHFIFRLLTYLSIWWAGVFISNVSLNKEILTIKNCQPILYFLGVINLILVTSLIIFLRDGGKARIGIHPFLEVRHHMFAVFAILAAILWRKYNWRGYNLIIGPFKFFAPISYVIYISHEYLVVDATYLNFIGNRVLEFVCYMLVLFIFSWIIELKIYPIMSRWLKNVARI